MEATQTPPVAPKFKHPSKEYIAAFLQYSGAKRKDIRFKRIDTEMMIEHEKTTYMVAHVDDFKDNWRSLIEGESYDEIYCSIPDPVWSFLLEEYVAEPPLDSFIVSIYKHWRSMWQYDPKMYKEKQWHNELREESWKDLQILIESIKLDWRNIMTNVRAIDDFHLVPAIAMAIYEQFEYKEEFFDLMAEYFIFQGDTLVTHGDTFEEVVLGDLEDEHAPVYYIYNPPYEFDT